MVRGGPGRAPRVKKDASSRKMLEPTAREATVHLAKRLHDISFKNRAPRAVREIKAFAAKMMGTKDVRITADLNKFVWSKGIRNVPVRVRVTLTRRRNDDEDAKEKMYTLVDHKPVGSDSKFTGLQTLVVEDADE